MDTDERSVLRRESKREREDRWNKFTPSTDRGSIELSEFELFDFFLKRPLVLFQSFDDVCSGLLVVHQLQQLKKMFTRLIQDALTLSHRLVVIE